MKLVVSDLTIYKIIQNMELKKEYLKPTIDITSIDNEIALILESEPPIGPQETLNIISTITHQIFKI